MHDLFAYTDGACSGNPGPGGWGVLLVAKNQGKIIKEKELFGGQENATNKTPHPPGPGFPEQAPSV